jgi:hypothetical protein
MSSRGGTKIRDCSLIEKDSSGSVELTLVIPETPYATIEAAGLEVFLYGAYNRITVCQMRVRGFLYSWKEERHKTEQAKARLRTKINGECESDPVNTLGSDGSFSKEQLRKRLALIEIGTVFTFLPRSYAYAFYERG